MVKLNNNMNFLLWVNILFPPRSNFNVNKETKYLSGLIFSLELLSFVQPFDYRNTMRCVLFIFEV